MQTLNLRTFFRLQALLFICTVLLALLNSCNNERFRFQNPQQTERAMRDTLPPYQWDEMSTDIFHSDVEGKATKLEVLWHFDEERVTLIQQGKEGIEFVGVWFGNDFYCVDGCTIFSVGVSSVTEKKYGRLKRSWFEQDVQ